MSPLHRSLVYDNFSCMMKPPTYLGVLLDVFTGSFAAIMRCSECSFPVFQFRAELGRSLLEFGMWECLQGLHEGHLLTRREDR